MGFFSKNHADTRNWVMAALRNDAKVLAENTEGKAASSPKKVMLIAGSFLVLAVSASLLSSHGRAASQTPSGKTVAEAKSGRMAQLTDFRLLDDEALTGSQTQRITLKPGDSLGPLLQKNGITANQAYAVTEAFSKVYAPRNLRAGQHINLYFAGEDRRFIGLSLKPDTASTVFVNKNGTGFSAKKIAAEFKKELVRVSAPITNSLYLDAKALGAPDKVIVQFSQIYAHSVDFQRDIRAGDRFEMLFELYRDHKGNPIKAGDLVFTSFAPHGKTSQYYLYEDSKGHEGYYDAKGKGAKRMLMRTPINGARLTSRFGYRKHPIKGYRKKHKGVDFGAPRGTPIMAGGTGTITHAGRYGGYGNYIRIRHSDGYSTAYGHMKGFARGIKRGVHVRQGQTIGYVGTTGLSTGPHLHYEVLKNGRQINPMRLATLTGKPLPKSERANFQKRVAKIKALREKAGPALIRSADLAVAAAPSSRPAIPATPGGKSAQ